MKVTLGWLKEHLETDADLAAIVAALTRIGLEVEGVADPGEKLAAFTVARVLSAAPHPQADKLQVLSVDAGSGPVQVVCGAPNARAGMLGVFGAPGATVPDSGIALKVAEIRGVQSNGMMCSMRELELGDAHDGIIELPADAPVGTSYPAYAGLDDPLIDIAITPNRQDCMGVRGIARDLAAAGHGTLRPLSEVYRMPADPVAQVGAGPDVRTDDPDGCPAFFGQAVHGLTNGTAPAWMRAKLTAVGQKPISTLVDITNFIMLDLGRPLHVYDRAKLVGGLVARKARAGEQVLALNGKTYALDAGMTVIADDAQVHDIGGIMGGAESGVGADTTDVVIECAYFTPEAIARTGQALNLTSDARQRFERGVDPAFLDDGLAIATWLVIEHCGGTASAVTRAGAPPVQKRTIVYEPSLCRTLGGLDVHEPVQQAILLRLGFQVFWDESGEGPLRIVVPTWRRDVDGPADLVEEVVRMVGLDAIASVPLTSQPGVAKPTATPDQWVERRVRRTAAARGMHEAVTWSFISEAEAAAFGGGAWTLANPISEELKVMRPSLLPGLIAAARRNADRGAASIRLFEIGRRYLPDAERPTVGFALAGDAAPRDWATGKARRFDAYDAKAEAMALLDAAGVPAHTLQLMDGASGAYHPGRSATLRLGPKTILAEFGMIHPGLARRLDVDGDLALGEVFLDALPQRRARGPGRTRSAYRPPALQAVTRDFAFLVPDDVAAGDLLRAIRGADKSLITAARVFDLFTGAGVPAGQRSIAVEVVLQPDEASFDETALTAIADRIVAAAAKHGATLRG